GQMMQSEVAYIVVKKKWSRIFNKECCMRLMIQHIGVHLLHFSLRDVWRIADDNIKILLFGKKKFPLQNVGSDKIYCCLQLLIVFFCNRNSRSGDVYSPYLTIGKKFIQGDRNTATACSDIDYFRSHVLLVVL